MQTSEFQSELAQMELQLRLEDADQHIRKLLTPGSAPAFTETQRCATIAGDHEAAAKYALLLGETQGARNRLSESSRFLEKAAVAALEPNSATLTHDFLSYTGSIRCAMWVGDKARAILLSQRPLEQHPKPTSGSPLMGYPLHMGLALPYLIRQEDDEALPHLNMLRIENSKKLQYPTIIQAVQTLVEADVSRFLDAFKVAIERHRRYAGNPNSQEHGLPSSFICGPLMTLAILSVWRGLVKPDDIPEAKGVLKLKTNTHEISLESLFHGRRAFGSVLNVVPSRFSFTVKPPRAYPQA